ncbi:phage tail protein [Neptunomonas concharum]|uniref:Phage tail protein n=1 Tax=Neptunomonas concharum TaxID=1031538 RepID=A0A5P1RD30_9GAMM|nr:tail fiber protein [Neptunomonas concharum]QEQ97176.1 phage tail protein [Neptunomonas concharum]
MNRILKSKFGTVSAGAVLSLAAILPNPASAASDPLLGEVMLVGFNFCPRGWMEAAGQLLPISQNTALFSLYGTIYGGDGRTTFALPDLRGRAPIGAGSGPGLSTYNQGIRGGTEEFTLLVQNMPEHNHSIMATSAQVTKGGPAGKLLAADNHTNKYTIYNGGSTPLSAMDSRMVTNTGGSQAVSKRSPYLAMKWCVATQGVYPSRS